MKNLFVCVFALLGAGKVAHAAHVGIGNVAAQEPPTGGKAQPENLAVRQPWLWPVEGAETRADGRSAEGNSWQLVPVWVVIATCFVFFWNAVCGEG